MNRRTRIRRGVATLRRRRRVSRLRAVSAGLLRAASCSRCCSRPAARAASAPSPTSSASGASATTRRPGTLQPGLLVSMLTPPSCSRSVLASASGGQPLAGAARTTGATGSRRCAAAAALVGGVAAGFALLGAQPRRRRAARSRPRPCARRCRRRRCGWSTRRASRSISRRCAARSCCSPRCTRRARTPARDPRAGQARDRRSCRREARADLRVVAVTLDPEPRLARGARRARGACTDSRRRSINSSPGPPAEVERVLDRMGIARARDPETGVIDHANLFLLLDRERRVAYRLTLGERQERWLVSALQLLLREPAMAAELRERRRARGRSASRPKRRRRRAAHLRRAASRRRSSPRCAAQAACAAASASSSHSTACSPARFPSAESVPADRRDRDHVDSSSPSSRASCSCFWYRPSVHQAYASVAATVGPWAAGLMRSLHRYSSDAAMFFALVHALRLFFERRFTGPRWLAWVTGIVGLGVLWFVGWTGYWLVWDLRGAAGRGGHRARARRAADLRRPDGPLVPHRRERELAALLRRVLHPHAGAARDGVRALAPHHAARPRRAS